jgi:mono/diheme cytochrome c family protein
VSGSWQVIAAAALAFGGTGTATYVVMAPSSPRLSPPPEQSLTESAAPAPPSSEVARELLRARCEVCHAPDLIVAHRLSLDDWSAEIAKMRRWGARLTDGEAADLARDLAERLGVDAGAVPGGRLDAREVEGHDGPQPSPWPPGSVERGAVLFQEGCATCHGSDGRGGTQEVRAPALVGRLIVQRPLDFEAAVRQGRWDMPSFGATLSASQMADVFAWVGSDSVPGAGRLP